MLFNNGATSMTDTIMINNKAVEESSLTVEGATWQDYPDLVDTFFAEGCYVDGSDLSDEDLDLLNETEYDLLYELAMDSLLTYY
jgi:hypothetical protein